MADKEKLSVSIEAVDNFSNVFKELNKKLEQLQKNQTKIDMGTVDKNLRNAIKLSDRLEELPYNKLAKLKGNQLEKEVESAVKSAKSISDSIDRALKGVSNTPINNKKIVTDTKRDIINFSAKEFENSLNKLKAPIEPRIDKKSVEKAQKETQKELDKKPLKQKVEVETKKKETTPVKEVEKEPKQTKTKTTKPVVEKEPVVKTPKKEVKQEPVRKTVKKEPVVTEVKKEPTPKVAKKETVEVVPKIDKKALQKEEVKVKATVDTSSLKIDKKSLPPQEVKVKATVDTTSLKINKKDLPKEEIKVKAVVDTSSLKIDKKSLPKEEIKVKAVLDTTSIKDIKKSLAEQSLKVKATIDENSLKSSLSAAVSKLNQNAPVIKLVTKLNSSGILTELKDISTKISKVEVPIAAKFSGFVSELKEQLKNSQPTVKVDAKVNATNLKSSIQESLKNITTSGVEVPLKVNSRGLITAINNVLKDSNIPSVNLSLKINQDKFDKSLGSIKTKLTNFLSTVYKIVIVVNEERFQKSFDKVKNKVDKFIAKNRKIKIDTDLRKISGKLQNLGDKLNQLANKTIKLKYDNDIELKLIRLSTYINNLNSNPIKIKANVDKSVQNLNTLFSTLIKLNSMHIDIKEGLALASVKRVKEALYGLKREVPKLQLDTSDVTVKNSQLKTTANTFKSIADTVKTLKSKKITYDFKTRRAETVVKLLRNLQNEMSKVNTTISVNVTVKENDSVAKLKEILGLVQELKKSRYVTISARANYGRGYGRGGRGGRGGRRIYDNDGEQIYGGFTSADDIKWLERIEQVRNFGRNLASLTQFIGRSSKGFGSFLEAVSKVTTGMINGSSMMTVFGTTIAVVSGTLSVLYAAGTIAIDTLRFFSSALQTATRYIYAALKPGIELYRQRQSSVFSFAAAIQSNGVLSNGKNLRDMGEEGRVISRGLAKELISKATLDAELSAFSLEDLLTSLQGTLPILMKLGMSIDQAYKVNKGVAAVAKMIRLSPNQVLQETRDIAQGSVTSRASQVANALGINNDDLKKYKNNADELFNYLMQKFANYSELLAEYEDTAVGRFEQLLDRWKSTAMKIVEPMAAQFKGIFEMLIGATGSWVDSKGNKLDVISNQWKDKNGNVLGNLYDTKDKNGNVIKRYEAEGIHFELADELIQARDILIDIIDFTAQLTDGIIELIRQETGLIDPVEAAKLIVREILKFTAGLLVMGIKILHFLWDNQDALFSIINGVIKLTALVSGLAMGGIMLWDVFKYLLNLITSIVRETGLWVKMLAKLAKGDFTGAGQTFREIEQTSHDGAMAKIKKEMWDDAKLTYYVGDILFGEQDYSSIGAGLKSLGYSPTQGKVTQAVRKYLGKKVDGTDKGDSKGVSLKDVKGETSSSSKDAVKESQKMLKEQLQKLKETLKDALGELKDILNKNKIAYDEGFMSIKDYFTQKANIEAQEAQLRLQEAYDEKAAINNAQFDNEYDRQKELHKIDREIRQYSRELGNAKTAISETNRALKESALSLNSFTEFMQNSLIGTKPRGNVPKQLPNGDSVFGYTPPAEYNRGGMDIRYADFTDMASGVDAQLDGMNESVKRLLNIINKMYYEQTGEKIIYTSFTGDLTGATENPHSDAKYGHRDGWKVDAVATYKDIYIALHELLGVATRWENDHFDSSYGPASTYTGGIGTEYTTGEAWFNKLQESITAGIRGGNLDFVPGSMDSFHLAPNTTALSHEAQQALETFNQKIQDIAVTFSENALDIYSTNFSAGARAKINEIAKKYQKQIKEINVNMKNNPELKESYSAALSNLLSNMNVEIEDALTSYLDKRLNYNIEAVKTWGNYAAFETFMGRGMKPLDFYAKYHKYFYNDKNNPLAPASVISKMWDSVINYQSLGAVDKAQELRKKILDKLNEINGIFDTHLNNITNYFSKYKDWLNSTDATNLQKEQGAKEIDSRYNEILSNILGQKIKDNTEQLERWQKELDGVIERLEKIDELQKSAGTSEEEKAKLETEKSKLIAQKDALNLQRQLLEMKNQELIMDKKIADANKDKDKYYKQLKEAAKQAIEDGLVHFLTDGINEAKNLGEALRNLAIDFLKTMQKFFAKKAVEDLMDIWFPQIKDENKNKYGQKQDAFAAATDYTDKFGNNNAEINPEQFLQQSMTMFEQSTQQASTNLDVVSQSATNASSSLDNLSSSAQQLTAAIEQSASVIQQASAATSTNIAVEQQETQATMMNTETEIVNTSATRQNTSATNDNTVAERQQAMATSMSGGMGGMGGVGGAAGALGGFAGSFSALSVNPGSYSGLFGSIMQPIGTLVNSILTPISKLITGIIDPITKMLNGSAFTQLQSSVMGLAGSAGVQLGGSFYAIKTLFDGDKKEKLLSMIFLELQLIYTTLSMMGNMFMASPMVAGFARGGIIKGPGSSTSDDIPAMLSNGEAVLNAKAVRKLGVNFISAVNNGEFSKITARIPHFANGGVVTDAMQSTARGMTEFAGNIATNVSTTNQMNIALVRDENSAMEHFMRSPKGQRILVDFNKGNSTIFSRFSNV